MRLAPPASLRRPPAPPGPPAGARPAGATPGRGAAPVSPSRPETPPAPLRLPSLRHVLVVHGRTRPLSFSPCLSLNPCLFLNPDLNLSPTCSQACITDTCAACLDDTACSPWGTCSGPCSGTGYRMQNRTCPDQPNPSCAALPRSQVRQGVWLDQDVDSLLYSGYVYVLYSISLTCFRPYPLPPLNTTKHRRTAHLPTAPLALMTPLAVPGAAAPVGTVGDPREPIPGAVPPSP